MTRFLGCLFVVSLAAAGSIRAQDAPVPVGVPARADSLDFGEFGDVDSRPVRIYATQKVLYQSPTKLISVGYEGQGHFDLNSVGPHRTAVVVPGPDPAPGQGTELDERVNRFAGLRLGFNAPVVSNSRLILNLGLTYWDTGVNINNARASPLFTELNRGLRSTSVNATVFKPLNEKHYLLIQGNADLSGTYRNFGDVSSKGLTYSGTAIYGWKPNENYMWGLGVTRTYRAGQLLHIPVIFYNRTYSAKWGVEAVFPARVSLRRSFGTNSLLTFGYEIEGNAYYLGEINGQDTYLRRGELKPRFTYERKLTGFLWLSAQAGYRYNWRFDAFSTQNPEGDDTPVFTNTLTNPLYFNVSINLVSP